MSTIYKHCLYFPHYTTFLKLKRVKFLAKNALPSQQKIIRHLFTRSISNQIMYLIVYCHSVFRRRKGYILVYQSGCVHLLSFKQKCRALPGLLQVQPYRVQRLLQLPQREVATDVLFAIRLCPVLFVLQESTAS